MQELHDVFLKEKLKKPETNFQICHEIKGKFF